VRAAHRPPVHLAARGRGSPQLPPPRFHVASVLVTNEASRGQEPNNALGPGRPSKSCAGSIPAASIIDRSPLPLAREHDDFDRFLPCRSACVSRHRQSRHRRRAAVDRVLRSWRKLRLTQIGVRHRGPRLPPARHDPHPRPTTLRSAPDTVVDLSSATRGLRCGGSTLEQ
jgi:hypothetical protein